MRLGLVVIALGVVAAAGCGSSQPLSKTAGPCLAKLGQYVRHRPRPIPPTNTVALLPVVDPDFRPELGRGRQGLAWPKELDEYGEISYGSPKAGANAVQILIFRSDDLPRRVMTATARLLRLQRQGGQNALFFLGSAPQPVRRDRTLVLWSSTPTTGQKQAVYGCLES
jgi:hypothetical protein